MSAQPTIPPRPSRAQGASSTLQQDAPIIPPRPARSTERSVSPRRAEYTRSPLNEPPVSMNNGKLYSQKNLSASDLPGRPPSVSLPSIGQEGLEYASFDSQENLNGSSEQTQTRNVAPDLPIYAPRASVPQSTAKTRIATVTRTDSSQAAAAGIGKAQTETNLEPSSHPLRGRSSFTRSNLSLNQTDTPPPGSSHGDHEQGIPEIGIQVPMLRFAGDVQAPSPSPFAQTESPGIGFFNDGSKSRNHNRKRSSRQEFRPPGSYGMHGHGQEPKDQFEKAWYQRHPEALVREHREYDPGHPKHDWALSSDDLNKLVRDSASRGIGMATSPDVVGTPSEQIGYLASEEYSSRMASPKPTPTPLSSLKKRTSSGASHLHAASPLRKQSFPFNEGKHDTALESEAEEDVIHIDPPQRRGSKVNGGGPVDGREDLGPEGGNTEEEGGWIDERGNGVPILASDEVAKNPEAEWMQPAVSPEQERKGSNYFGDSDGAPAYQSGRRGSRSQSRPSSRPSSMHGEPLSRFISREGAEGSGMGTPLEEIEEYEPLFPEDDEGHKKPKSQADRLRPELARHHFPSQDVWEDTPTSLQLQTTVETPQMPEDESKEPESATQPSAVFESPEKEQARKEGPIASDRAHFLHPTTEKLANKNFKPGVLEEVESSRPGMRHRFPSRDIWEDTPDSLQLQTTVDTPQTDEQQEMFSPPDAKKPEIPSRPQKQPEVPARPARTAAKDAPSIPDRPKPQVPVRPARPSRSESQESAPLSKVTSAGSAGSAAASETSATSNVTSPPVPKTKPTVPARAAGVANKFAQLKAGFMNDLNSRLQLGPQAPPKPAEKEEEKEVAEKKPLEDARKGRARGPARRKPAAAAAEEGEKKEANTISFSISSPQTIFQIDDTGALHVPSQHHSAPLPSNASADVKAAETAIEQTATANTTAAAPPAEMQSTPPPSAPAATAPDSIVTEKEKLSGFTPEAIGAPGDTPEPRLDPVSVERGEAIRPVLEEALRESDPDLSGGAQGAEAREQKKEAEAVSDQVAEAALSSSRPAEVAETSTHAQSQTSTEPQPQSSTTSSQTQTGQQDISVTGPKGEKEAFTTYLGGAARKEGNVVVLEDGSEVVGDMDERHRSEATGHGM